jgi:acyl-CoA thioester hydrolase
VTVPGHPLPFGETAARPPFRFSATTRVGFDETDAQGVVYYGRYMPYFDRARVEYLRHLGLLAASPGAFKEFVMRANHVEYHAPATFDDLLEVYVRVSRVGRTSVGWEYAAERGDGTLLCTAEQTLVQIDLPGRRPVAVADDFRERVGAFEAAGS